MSAICQIYLSPGHNFFGHHGRPPSEHPMLAVREAECVAGRGLRGDRFFDYRPDYAGQVTLFSAEVLAALRAEFSGQPFSAGALRRNVLVAGLDLSSCVGRTFALQETELEGVEECRPCFWMNTAIAAGAERWLRGHGGLRCRIRRGGWLRLVPQAMPHALSGNSTRGGR